MNRFYIPPADWNLDKLVLDESESHHALDVLRLGVGDRVVVFNGRGVEATAEIAEAKKSGAVLQKLHVGKTPPLTCRVTLGQAIPKGKNMDLIVQKATELGASVIAPLLSERTVVQCSADEALKKREKWQAVAVEAAKQCGQNWLPEVLEPVTPRQFFEAGRRFDLMLIASLQTDSRHLKSILAELPAPPTNVLILVGPEGDFTPAESALARSHGCRSLGLGPIILRTETAAFYCLSVLSHELNS